MEELDNEMVFDQEEKESLQPRPIQALIPILSTKRADEEGGEKHPEPMTTGPSVRLIPKPGRGKNLPSNG